MFNKMILCCAIALVSSSVQAQSTSNNPLTQAELDEITARGRALAEHDVAAWHSSDAVEALKPAEGPVELYIARKVENGWVVMWGKFNQAKDKFLIVYEARQGATPTEFNVTKHDPPLEDSDFYLHAAKAHELGAAEFLRDINPHRPYNISILPTASGDWYVYAIPAQTENGVLPYGGDIRYRISADGTKIIEKRQMHKTVLEQEIDKTSLGFHTHILSDIPEDSDVFYAMTLNSAKGDWIATRKYFYDIQADGSIRTLGSLEEVEKLIQEGKMEILQGPYRAMALEEIRRLANSEAAPVPLEAFLAFSDATCKGNAIWLKFSVVVHNTSETAVILHKEALNDAQVRFGESEKGLLAEKYQKIALITPTQLDFSNNNSYRRLGPGMVYYEEREFPALGVNLEGMTSVEILFLTWPVGTNGEGDKEKQRARLANFGFLYTETIDAHPAPLKIDPALLKSCHAK